MPVCAYQVSGEYAMIKAAARERLDRRGARRCDESLTLHQARRRGLHPDVLRARDGEAAEGLRSAHATRPDRCDPRMRRADVAVWWIRAPGGAGISVDASAETDGRRDEFATSTVTVEPVAARGVSSGRRTCCRAVRSLRADGRGRDPRLGPATLRYGPRRLDSVARSRRGFVHERARFSARGMRVDKRSQYSFEGLAPGPYWSARGPGRKRASRERASTCKRTCASI